MNSYFGNRSIVVHAANLTRLNCGNFTLASGTQSNSSSGSNSTSTAPGSSTATGSSTVTGSATSPNSSGKSTGTVGKVVSGAAIVVSVAAAALVGL